MHKVGQVSLHLEGGNSGEEVRVEGCLLWVIYFLGIRIENAIVGNSQSTRETSQRVEL